ncbi:MAG: lytic transglycosylase domain-containing protein [Fervidobacterium sp.]|uniref:Soluble lytic murein transglycosylase n=1 Tax=Fervidobacterium gondwanense DSM 13020 TaxID=1121883 RepID=A0A1M7SMD0_FERGO|nr:lytic transglycosylase domain-containing protein [Fervidobacterium gondwanense]UXF01470.1 lytic transglycosylase [Fervidobacterium riparium]SHN59601.1 soluble lytic murein transglycosylase [Fervidobacterium gondwanense DSM 13020]
MRVTIAILLFGIIIFFSFFVRIMPLKYYDIVVQYSGKLDPLLVVSVIRTESSFRPDAVSNMGAYGLMQLMPSTAEWVNKKFKTNYDYTTIEGNIALGCLYLNYLLEKDGDLKTALVHYNTGPYAPDDVKSDAGERYVFKVMRYYKLYTFLYGRLGGMRR